MLCPKCKSEIKPDGLKCEKCGTRVGRVCPNCKTHNVVTAFACKSCGYTLLKTCKNCGATNTTKSTTCRRCGAFFNKDDEQSVQRNNASSPVIDDMPKYEAIYYNHKNAEDKLKQAVLDPDVKVVALNGDSGVGKNLIIRFVTTELKDRGMVWLNGKCSPHTKLTPFGYMQDVLLNLLNLNNFCIDIEGLKKDSLKFFKNDFPTLTNDEVVDFINFLYPAKFGEFKNIHKNKERTISILMKIFKTIQNSMDIVFVVDNFSDIDVMSKEVIKRIISTPDMISDITFILTYTEPRSAIVCLPHKDLQESAYENITVAPFTREQLVPILDKYKNLELSIEQKNLVHKYSNGNPANFEQIINLIADKNRNGYSFALPQDMGSVISERLGILKIEDRLAYKVLMAIAVLGCKSNPIILNTFLNIDLEQLDLILNKLTQLNYIVAVSNVVYEFKSVLLWEMILSEFKKDITDYKEVCDQLFVLLQNYSLSSLATLSFIAKDMQYTQEYLSIWTTGVQTASYIGDTELFITAQKQILNIVETNKVKSSDNIKKNIYIQSGKLLEENNPAEAEKFLSNALNCEGISEFEQIDLLGYLASCAMKNFNYYGVIECVDNVLDKFDNPHSLQYAMVKSRKLKALNKIGNFGEVVNVSENEIIPIIEGALSKRRYNNKLIPEKEVFDTWIAVFFELSKALTRQGNERAFKVIGELFKILEANDIKDKQFACNLQLELALANTMKGNIAMSNKILNDIFEVYKNSEVINSFVVSRLNLISLLNKFFTERDKIEIDELFKIATFADNINDKFTKNISKLILGKVVLQTQSAQNAIDIYTKQLEYFAKEKNAVGVLLGWYLTAEATILVDKQKALDIAIKALSIAQKPEICNHYFSLLFDKLICKIYISMKDYDSARVYVDRALTIAKGYDIQYQLAKLYIMSGDCLKEKVNSEQDKKEVLLKAKDLYERASDLNEKLKINSISKVIVQKMKELDILSQANGITL